MTRVSLENTVHAALKAGPLTAMAWVLALAVIAVWLGLALWANLDASSARHMLFMDELITHDGVQYIYDAESPAHAVKAAMENDQRYGRTTFYLSFIASTLGDAFAGEQGRIVANRMAFALTTCAAVCVLSWALLETAFGRLLGVVAGLTVPMASYYATMPKPDPLMVLFLGLYFLAWRRNGHGFGLSMIWLGLCFGAKIAAFPAMVFLIPMVIFHARITGYALTPPAIKQSGLSFLAGFLISVPIIVSSFPKGLSYYLQQTWMNRTHVHDEDGTGILDWISQLQTSAFFGDGPATFAVLFIFAGLIAAAAWLAAGQPKTANSAKLAFEKLFRSRYVLPLAATICGAAMLGAIMVSTDRLWLFYLFPGALLVTLGAAAAFERLIIDTQWAPRAIRGAGLTAGSLAFAASALAGAKFLHEDFEAAANRSTTDKFLRHQIVYEAFVREVDAYAQAAGGEERLRVAFNAHFWAPQTTDTVLYYPYYNAFWHWTLELDMVALGPEQMNRMFAADPVQNLPSALEGERLLPLHTNVGGPCTLAPCYRQIDTGAEAEGLFLFARDPGADPQSPAFSQDTSS
ncbi:MAG: hypothetical protein AAFX86_11970 [Pseudomonadota bacterium]